MFTILIHSVKIAFCLSQVHIKLKVRPLETLLFPDLSSILPSHPTKLSWTIILNAITKWNANSMRKHQRKEQNRVKKGTACTNNQGHRRQQWSTEGHDVSIETGACALLRPQHRWLKSGRPYSLKKGGGQQGYSTSDELFFFLYAEEEDRLQLWDT